MAIVQRLSLSQIETALLELLHYPSSAVAPWGSSANLYLRINSYIQRLPVTVAGLMNAMRVQAKQPPLAGVPRFDMWRTQGSMTTAPGDKKAYFPADCDQWISFYDETSWYEINVVKNVNRYHPHLKSKPPGAIEAIEIFGGLPAQSPPIYTKYGILYPAPPAGVQPDITIEYWRIPRAMPGTSAATEYPDLEPKYSMLAVWGPASDMSRSFGKDFARYEDLEKQMLLQLSQTAILE